MIWPRARVKNKRWTIEGYSPAWKRGRQPFFALHKVPPSKRARGRATRDLSEAWPYIVLKARAKMHLQEGASEREAIAKGMIEMAWEPATYEEIERVRREVRRLG
jgi:hypothetical protein